MCSADKEVRSSSQRQEGAQLHPCRAGLGVGPEVCSAWLKHKVGLEGCRGGRERDGPDCVMQRFWILCHECKGANKEL